MTKKTKYLTYIEETKKHHTLIEDEAKSSVKKAITESHEKSVAVTFMKGKEIVKVDSKGKKTLVGVVENNRRKVKVGAKTTLSKK